jgi:hypothetical protein
MDSINELNVELTTNLEAILFNTRAILNDLDSVYPEVIEVKELLLNFDVEQYSNKTFEILQQTLINEWQKYQSNDEVDFYDMIYFEYHEQSFEYPDAMSYGIFDMVNFNSSIEPHDFSYEYKFGYWEAGLGLHLDPFLLSKAISYRAISDEKYADLISFKDPSSGCRQLWDYIDAACKFSFNSAFKKADELNIFEKVKLKKGGLFVLDMHDNGSVWTPFYIKK